MKIFPVTIIDNFFDNPDEIRDYALSCQFTEKSIHYPGTRTKELKELNPQLYRSIFDKIFALQFSQTVEEYDVMAHFHMINPLHPDPNNIKNTTWIHTDGSFAFAGIIYLNPNANVITGTSIYRQKQIDIDTFDKYKELREKPLEAKNKFYHSGIDDNYDNYLLNWNSEYEETIKIGNVYNRFVMYDSQQHHAATNIHSKEDPRLTLVFFVKQIKSTQDTHLMRMRKIEMGKL